MKIQRSRASMTLAAIFLARTGSWLGHTGRPSAVCVGMRSHINNLRTSPFISRSCRRKTLMTSWFSTSAERSLSLGVSRGCPLVFTKVRFSSSVTTESYALLDDEEQEEEEKEVHPPDETRAETLLHPDTMFNGTIPYPKALSPSAILEFQACPQSFLFQYLYGLRQPTSPALAKGSMCHSALEKVFDLEPENRTLEHLQNLFRSTWSEHRMKDSYRVLFEKERDGKNGGNKEDPLERDLEAESAWGRAGLGLLANYYRLEDPRTIIRPNPVRREVWVSANLSVYPENGVTGYALPRRYRQMATYNDHIEIRAKPRMENASEEEVTPPPDTFLVRGIVDRLDMIKVDPFSVALRLVDYKTGKAPELKYSASVNRRIVDEKFFQLKIYALLLRENAKTTGSDIVGGLDLRFLRLFYLTSEHNNGARWIDFDLGVTKQDRDAVLQDVHRQIADVWNRIVELVSLQDPKAWPGCDRPFCYCHTCRERFVPGTVWEPPSNGSPITQTLKEGAARHHDRPC